MDCTLSQNSGFKFKSLQIKSNKEHSEAHGESNQICSAHDFEANDQCHLE